MSVCLCLLPLGGQGQDIYTSPRTATLLQPVATGPPLSEMPSLEPGRPATEALAGALTIRVPKIVLGLSIRPLVRGPQNPGEPPVTAGSRRSAAES